jgi:hypothetical protein
MVLRINYNEEKNQLLKATRGICFENVIMAIKEGSLIADLHHPNIKYSHQKIFVISITGYMYAVPYVINMKKREIYLKTVYPSRSLTKKYSKGVKHVKTKSK